MSIDLGQIPEFLDKDPLYFHTECENYKKIAFSVFPPVLSKKLIIEEIALSIIPFIPIIVPYGRPLSLACMAFWDCKTSSDRWSVDVSIPSNSETESSNNENKNKRKRTLTIGSTHLDVVENFESVNEEKPINRMRNIDSFDPEEWKMAKIEMMQFACSFVSFVSYFFSDKSSFLIQSGKEILVNSIRTWEVLSLWRSSSNSLSENEIENSQSKTESNKAAPSESETSEVKPLEFKSPEAKDPWELIERLSHIALNILEIRATLSGSPLARLGAFTLQTLGGLKHSFDSYSNQHYPALTSHLLMTILRVSALYFQLRKKVI